MTKDPLASLPQVGRLEKGILSLDTREVFERAEIVLDGDTWIESFKSVGNVRDFARVSMIRASGMSPTMSRSLVYVVGTVKCSTYTGAGILTEGGLAFYSRLIGNPEINPVDIVPLRDVAFYNPLSRNGANVPPEGIDMYPLETKSRKKK